MLRTLQLCQEVGLSKSYFIIPKCFILFCILICYLSSRYLLYFVQCFEIVLCKAFWLNKHYHDMLLLLDVTAWYFLLKMPWTTLDNRKGISCWRLWSIYFYRRSSFLQNIPTLVIDPPHIKYITTKYLWHDIIFGMHTKDNIQNGL